MKSKETKIVGYLTNNVKLSTAKNGNRYCRINVKAANNSNCFAVQIWGSLAERLCKAGHKRGDPVGISGELHSRNVQGIDCRRIYFIAAKNNLPI